jgi:rhodanese-related sulfurtransferase
MAGSNARPSRAGKRSAAASRSTGARSGNRPQGRSRTGLGTWAWLGGGIVVAVVVLAVAIGIASAPSSPATSGGTVVQGNGGTWTNISVDTLASKMQTKDFTLLNVKTPYIGEISGTDLYIPYTDIPARASELPADKSAPIVVYCRTGTESAIAAQELLDLGYTNIENLDGGMTAWTASGRSLVQVARS